MLTKSIKNQYRNHFTVADILLFRKLEKIWKVTSSIIFPVKVLTKRIFEVESESATSDLKAKYIADFAVALVMGLDMIVFLVNNFLLSLMQGPELLSNYILFS